MRESLSPAQAFNGYGYFWWLLGDGIYAAEGIFGQVIWIDSKNNLVIALQSSWSKLGATVLRPSGWHLGALSKSCWQEINFDAKAQETTSRLSSLLSIFVQNPLENGDVLYRGQSLLRSFAKIDT